MNGKLITTAQQIAQLDKQIEKLILLLSIQRYDTPIAAVLALEDRLNELRHQRVELVPLQEAENGKGK